MNIVSYGGGTDSTAMLIECAKRGIKIDLILFADTGGEKPHTYEYIKLFNQWLIDNGMPEITIVKAIKKDGSIHTLERDCSEQNMLPSLAYGFKSCSQKFKISPQNKYVNNWPKTKEYLKAGNKIIKFIGYDAGEDRRAKPYEDDKYINYYPLVEWDIDRDQCIEIIKDAGLPLPGKSACFFCPSSKPHEVKNLMLQYPDLAKRAIQMEKNADLTSIKGLGRNWSWGALLATDDMFNDEPIHCIEIDCGCYDG